MIKNLLGIKGALSEVTPSKDMPKENKVKVKLKDTDVKKPSVKTVKVTKAKSKKPTKAKGKAKTKAKDKAPTAGEVGISSKDKDSFEEFMASMESTGYMV